MLTVNIDESGIVMKVIILILSKILIPIVRKSLVFKGLILLPKRDRRKLMFICIVQILLGALDLLGVAAIG